MSNISELIKESNDKILKKMCPFLKDYCSKECQFFTGATYRSPIWQGERGYISQAICSIRIK